MGKHYYNKKEMVVYDEIIYNENNPKMPSSFTIIGAIFLSGMVATVLYILFKI